MASTKRPRSPEQKGLSPGTKDISNGAAASDTVDDRRAGEPASPVRKRPRTTSEGKGKAKGEGDGGPRDGRSEETRELRDFVIEAQRSWKMAELEVLVNEWQAGRGRAHTVAWSRHNLIAYSSPQPRTASSPSLPSITLFSIPSSPFRPLKTVSLFPPLGSPPLDSATYISFSPTGLTLVAYFPPPTDGTFSVQRTDDSTTLPGLEDLAGVTGSTPYAMQNLTGAPSSGMARTSGPDGTGASGGLLCIWSCGSSGCMNDWILRQSVSVAPLDEVGVDLAGVSGGQRVGLGLGLDHMPGTSSTSQRKIGGAVKELVWLGSGRQWYAAPRPTDKSAVSGAPSFVRAPVQGPQFYGGPHSAEAFIVLDEAAGLHLFITQAPRSPTVPFQIAHTTLLSPSFSGSKPSTSGCSAPGGLKVTHSAIGFVGDEPNILVASRLTARAKRLERSLSSLEPFPSTAVDPLGFGADLGAGPDSGASIGGTGQGSELTDSAAQIFDKMVASAADEDRIELTEVNVQLDGEASTLSARPLPPIYLTTASYPPSPSPSATDSQHVLANAPTHLVFLPVHSNSSTSLQSNGPTARLAAVFPFAAADPSAMGDSVVRTWELTRRPREISDVFAQLECKKADVGSGPNDWTHRELPLCRLQGEVVTSLCSEDSPTPFTVVLGSFKLGESGRISESLRVVDPTSFEALSMFEPVYVPSKVSHSSDLAVSPNRSLACSSPSTHFPRVTFLPYFRSKPSDDVKPLAHVEHQLGLDLVLSMLRDNNGVDVVRRAVGLDRDALVRVLRATWEAAHAQLHGKSDPRLILELLRLQFAMFRATEPKFEARQVNDLQLLLELIIADRAFNSCQAPATEAKMAGMAFKQDIVWPLIGYTSWLLYTFGDLVRSASLERARRDFQIDSGAVAVPDGLFLLLHPFSRQVIHKLVNKALSFRSFINEPNPVLSGSAKVTFDVARDVVRNLFVEAAIDLEEMKKMLDETARDVDGAWKGLQPRTAVRDALIDLSLPEPVLPLATRLLEELATRPGLADRLSLFMPTNGDDTGDPLRQLKALSNTIDVIRKAKLPLGSAPGTVKCCLRCGSLSSVDPLPGALLPLIELAHELHCVCGGPWWAE